jgi:hypothetical protein
MERLVDLLYLDADRVLYRVKSIVSEYPNGLSIHVAKVMMLELGH